MSKKVLAEQVEAYNRWKQSLSEEIGHYHAWLSRNELASDDVIHRLERGLSALKEDQLTIAFVGEYSRGKTELINSLLFAGYGQRMLPSQPGRTTMCPTELFYDQVRQSSYLKLLPIETRMQDKSIAQLKLEDGQWQELSIQSADPDKLSECLMQVAATRSATVSEARALGFDEHMLEHDEADPEKVIIPLWRHAMISLDNHLLKQGLNILDTPGLNALGSEPELTISMIPQAQAIIFLLSADAGVTASDMAIWENYIDTDNVDHRAGRFAVLNKIDVLWDDLQGEQYTQAAIERVRKDTALKLGITSDDVIPLSAKQALLARVRKDDLLLQKSAIANLEKLITKRILQPKESLLYDKVVKDISEMLGSSQNILNKRLTSLKQQLNELKGREIDPQALQDFAAKTHEEHDNHYRKLIALKSSRRLMKSQGEILQQLAGQDIFDALVSETEQALQESWSTLGLKRAMEQFFVQLDKLVDGVCVEAQLADKMVSAIYDRFKRDTSESSFHPKPFSVKRERAALRDLKQQAKRFRRNPKMIMTEQTLLIKRFFGSFVQQARSIHREILKEAERWPDEALLPLIQFSLEQKKALEKQVGDLKALASDSRNNRDQREALAKLIDKVQFTVDQAKQIESRLSAPPDAVSNLAAI